MGSRLTPEPASKPPVLSRVGSTVGRRQAVCSLHRRKQGCDGGWLWKGGTGGTTVTTHVFGQCSRAKVNDAGLRGKRKERAIDKSVKERLLCG